MFDVLNKLCGLVHLFYSLLGSGDTTPFQTFNRPVFALSKHTTYMCDTSQTAHSLALTIPLSSAEIQVPIVNFTVKTSHLPRPVILQLRAMMK